MDSTVTGYIDGVLSTVWTNLIGNSSFSSDTVMPSVLLGYGGSAMAFFFSIAGAYITGSKLVSSTEAGFFTFLEDF
jgi:hypothetical protein